MTTLILTSSPDIRSLDTEPRHVHNAGVWFTDGTTVRMLTIPEWEEMDRPTSIPAS